MDDTTFQIIALCLLFSINVGVWAIFGKMGNRDIKKAT